MDTIEAVASRMALLYLKRTLGCTQKWELIGQPTRSMWRSLARAVSVKSGTDDLDQISQFIAESYFLHTDPELRWNALNVSQRSLWRLVARCGIEVIRKRDTLNIVPIKRGLFNRQRSS